jgi:ribosomal protein L24
MIDGRIEGSMLQPILAPVPLPPPRRASAGTQPPTVLSNEEEEEIQRREFESLEFLSDDEEEASFPSQNDAEGSPSGAVLAAGEEVLSALSQGRDAVENVEERYGGIADGRIEGSMLPLLVAPLPRPPPRRSSAGTQPPLRRQRQQRANQPSQSRTKKGVTRQPLRPRAALAPRQATAAGGEGIGPGLEEENFPPNGGGCRHAPTADRSARMPNKKSYRPSSKSDSSTTGGEITCADGNAQQMSQTSGGVWMVSCHTGRENNLAHQISNTGKLFGILLVVPWPSTGKIYIQGNTEADVKQTIRKVSGIKSGSMQKLNGEDAIIALRGPTQQLKKDEWVRIKGGHHAGALALVRAVVRDAKDSGDSCIVQCVPRLDYAQTKGKVCRVGAPQKIFLAKEAQDAGRGVSEQPLLDWNRKCLYVDNKKNFPFCDGFLLNKLKVGSVKRIADVGVEPPKADELALFLRDKGDPYPEFVNENDSTNNNIENEGSDNRGATDQCRLYFSDLSELRDSTHLVLPECGAGAGLAVGDTVEVIAGEQRGMMGKITLQPLDETANGTVQVKLSLSDGVDDGNGGMNVMFQASQVRKHIPINSHVKVVDGMDTGKTGHVVAVKEPAEGDDVADGDRIAVVVVDDINTEISVRISQLRESADVSSGQDKLQSYELYDVVVLSGSDSTSREVGVIVRVGHVNFTVIDRNGIAREVRPEELRGKKKNSSYARDQSGNELRCKDTVTVVEGRHNRKTATIHCVSRGQLFLRSHTWTEHAGIFVVRSCSCNRTGKSSQNQVNPFAFSQSHTRGSGTGHVAVQGKCDDGYLGKTVNIEEGKWKGHQGTVKDATATHFKVELWVDSFLKTVSVVRELVKVVGDKFGAIDAPIDAPIDARHCSPTAKDVSSPSSAKTTAALKCAHGGLTPTRLVFQCDSDDLDYSHSGDEEDSYLDAPAGDPYDTDSGDEEVELFPGAPTRDPDVSHSVDEEESYLVAPAGDPDDLESGDGEVLLPGAPMRDPADSRSGDEGGSYLVAPARDAYDTEDSDSSDEGESYLFPPARDAYDTEDADDDSDDDWGTFPDFDAHETEGSGSGDEELYFFP